MICRVSSSFLRVGHLELFARRVRDGWGGDPRNELRQLVLHAMRREYPDTQLAPRNVIEYRESQRFKENSIPSLTLGAICVVYSFEIFLDLS